MTQPLVVGEEYMAHRLSRASWRTIFTAGFIASAALVAGAAASTAQAQEPAECLSFDPSDWPAPSKPYFMLALDTSGSMADPVGSATSCGYAANSDRRAHLRCAVQNTALAFGGEVNFGLATFAAYPSNCTGACYANCQYFGYNGGCGNGSNATRRSAIIPVPMQQDDFWNSPPTPNNINNVLAWTNDQCGDQRELFAAGPTPINGMLRDMRRYFQGTYVHPSGAPALPSPLAAQDLSGPGVNGGTGCRDINVILITDGDETCDSQAQAVAAATALYNPGVDVGGKNFRIRTHVINFAGGSQANSDAIALAGGTGASLFANNEVSLAQGLSNIISSAINPEVCDNGDNNCNGCTDEGYRHYCNVAQTCCSWTNVFERDTCLNDYEASLATMPPDGDLTLLPCTTVQNQTEPSNWLCFDPGETCDDLDNNCQNGPDEGVLKCGNPAQCPSTEICDGDDNDCDGFVDEGVCGGCVPSPEICDGCDNNCDGIADNGAPSANCGLPSPPQCIGTANCLPAQVVPNPGDCVAGGGYDTCSNNPSAEVCNGIDDNCNGSIDEGLAPTTCVPPGTPPGLVYGAPSLCRLGTQPCGGTCTGFVGPSTEVCNGIDDDCNGIVDDNVFLQGDACGVNQPPCSPGTYQCINGALSCVGGTQPGNEVCDGVDNDCDGLADEAPLFDAPAPGNNGCWNQPGNCCQHQGLFWCPPAGGACNGLGALTSPCNSGTLACAGGAGWVCQNPNGPNAEVCDGIDNNCNGAVDDGSLPMVGDSCPDMVNPPCLPGTVQCQSGVLDCVGDVGPNPEICDNIDNNCDGVIDNVENIGLPCTPAYDTTLYPGPRNNPPCQPGILQCDGMGNLVCTGGLGPSPEVCDGIDNDCDGNVDEVGAAPDGINGTMNPFPPPDGVLGDACGPSEGSCEQGTYACVNGQFACVGSVGPEFESCDCLDNDCDGVQDNPNNNNVPPLCSPGKSCVSSSEGCQCAQPCMGGEQPCPAGQECESVTSSETGQPIGSFCIAKQCADCDTKTVLDGQGTVLCAPSDVDDPTCANPPECVCKGQNGCKSPCFGVSCTGGLVCATSGTKAGSCQADNCWNVPCQGCDKACNLGACVDNPCDSDTCQPDEVCKPNPTFTDYTCVASCAGLNCPSGTECVSGECVTSCDPECGNSEVCDLSQDPPACVMNMCLDEPCTDGSCCDPVTGECGNCPCEGIVCPSGEVCDGGECYEEMTTNPTTSSVGGGGGQGGQGGGQGGIANGGAGGSKSGDDVEGAFGLATGGGGCSCEVGTERSRTGQLGWLAALLGLGMMQRRRRRRDQPRRAGQVEGVGR